MHIQDNVVIFPGSIIKSYTIIKDHVILGCATRIDEGVTLHPYATICNRVKVGDGSVIHEYVEIAFNVTIGANVKAFENVKIHECVVVESFVILNEHSEIKCNLRIAFGAFIGENCLIANSVPEGAIIYESVELLPNDSIEMYDIIMAHPSSLELYNLCLGAHITSGEL